MIKLILQKKFILIRKMNQKNVYFAIIGIFLNKKFSYGPCLSCGCYNIVKKSISLKNIAIDHVKKVYTEITFKI